jgi:TIR domain
MGFLSNFDEDVFISYAHNDDDVFAPEPWGWVTRLHQDLEQRVRNYLGADVRFWRDCEIRNNDDFTNKILKRLTRTASFLSVLSPSFLQRDWCKRELDAFTGNAEMQMGVLVDNERSRIFKVEKTPVERSALPPAMQGTKTYRFYEPDPAQPKRLHELRPLLGGEYYRRYFEEMDELAKDIAALLRDMMRLASEGGNQTEPKRDTVYVAETTSDVDDKAGELRRDLKDRGHLVLPAGDLPYRANAYKDKVRECLKQAALSVHLVGAEYGFVPEGEIKSNVWLQHDLAMERAAEPNFLRLIWMPRGISPSDERQQEFINYLHEDASVQGGADLLNSNLEELKTVIHERLAKQRRQQENPELATVASGATMGGVSKCAPDEPFRVYIMCDAADRKSPSLVALRKWLLSQRCEPILPSESEDESTAVQIHSENLGLCDACLIYYGEGSPQWFEAKLRDLRKFLRGRQPPVGAKAVYIAPPSNECKNEVETLEAIVLRGGETFSPAVIEPFMQKIVSLHRGPEASGTEH